MTINGKHLLAVTAVAGAAYLLCKKKGIDGIGRSSCPEDEKPILNLYYYGKDSMDRDTFIAEKGQKIFVVIDCGLKNESFLQNENNTHNLCWAYPINDPYYHEPDYPVDDSKYDIYLDNLTWQQNQRKKEWYRFAYEN